MSGRECTGCRQWKPWEQFVRDASKATGYGPRCRECHRNHEAAAKAGAIARRKPFSLAQLFEQYVDRGEGCWLWTGYGAVYGRLRVGDRWEFAHRIAWERSNGPIPDGLHVLHRCDVPKCVRPDHLFLGTIADNNRDRHDKGRDATGDRNGSRLHPEKVPSGDRHPSRLYRGRHAGEANPNAKLSDADVAALRVRRAAGEAVVDLAREFDVHPRYLGQVLRGHSR